MSTTSDGTKILKFVNVDDSKEEHLRRAANAASKAHLDVLWISPDEILNSKNMENENSFFVLDPFEGEHYECLKSQKCRIFGPQCVLSCLNTHSPLPSLSHAIFSISMNGIYACCSSVVKHERQRLHEQIRLMGGAVLRDFTDGVTHLIAGEVGSKKYAVACSLGKPIMLPEWVFAVWEEGQTKHILATDKQFDKYKCPVFKGCTICVTGLDGPTRQEVKRLCNSNGGEYSGELSMNTCTHLLVNMPKGEKYEFARKWNIHCVSTQWFYDCLKSGFWLDESSYRTLPEDEASLSQPGSRLNLSATANASQVSSKSRAERSSTTAAQAAYKSAKTHGDGDLITDETKKKKVHNDLRNLSDKTINNTSTLNLDLDFTLKQGCMFLDGCKIYLSGFSGALLDKIRKFINVGGGTRFSMINENVSHVIIGSVVTQDMELLKNSDFHPHVVTAHWIVDSAKNGKRMSEEDYIHPDFKMESDVSTPSSKENKDPANTNNKQSEKKGLNGNKSTISGKQKSVKPEYDDGLNDDEVFLQYGTAMGHQLDNDRTTSSSRAGKESTEDEDTTLDDEGEKHGLLSGKNFIIEHFYGEQTEHLKELIEEHGGRIVMRNECKSADLIVLPMNVECDPSLAKEMVTFCWLEQCIQEKILYDPDSNFLFRPFTIPKGVSPLDGCVMSISQYVGVERDHLMQLAELLGANCQETFVHKANRRFLVSTHLLCKEAKGSKYDAALKWNIPVVTCEWLFSCAESGTLQPVEDFPIEGKTITARQTKSNAATSKENIHQNVKDLEDQDGCEEGLVVEGHNAEQIDQGIESVIEKSNSLTNFSTKKPFRPSFDVTDAMQALESPLLPSVKSRKSRSSRNSFALDGFFEKNIIKAVQRTGNLGSLQPSSTETHSNDSNTEINNQEEASEAGILHGVVVVVSKKLSQQQAELYGIASSLGADYRWVFDNSCTHLIHQGKANDNSKDVSLAKEQGKYITSPHWLHACAEANSRLDENLYPHTYNPKMSLQGVKKERRITRASKAALDESVNQDTTLNEPEAPTKMDDPSSDETKVSLSIDTNSHISEDSREAGKDTSQNSKQDSEMSDPKEDFQKQIENFISANKGTRGRRRSRRHTSSSVSSSTPINSAGQSYEGDMGSRLSIRRGSSRLRTRNSQRDLDKLGDNKSCQKPFDESEASQSDTITYDDPVGRLEREKIMARLKRGCSPSSDDYVDNHEDHNDDDNQQDDDDAKNQDQNAENIKNGQRGSSLTLAEQIAIVSASDNADSESSQSTQTPVPPPLALQVKNVPKPTPQNLLEELEKSQDKPKEILKFQLSAMTPQEKIDFAALIEELGGRVFDTQYFKPDCSHVVIGKPNRNEKYLAAMAAGKWVLHKSFLEDSRQVGHFVDEEPHEWGTEVPGEEPNKLAKAAKRWRVKLETQRKTSDDPNLGAFSGWRVLLYVDKLRQPGFKRLLEAGGAQVVGSRPPFNNIDNVSHAFIDSNKMKPDAIDISALYDAGIWLVKPDFIAEFLMQDPEPHPGRFLIPEAIALSRGDDRMDTSEQRKRKGEELSTGEKRARIE